MIFVLLCLATLTQQNIFELHPCCSTCQNVICFYIRVTFSCIDRPRFGYPFFCWWTLVSTFRLPWITLQWTSVYKYLFDSPLSIILGKYLGVEFPGRMVILCLTFWGMAINFAVTFIKPHLSKKLSFQQVLNITMINELSNLFFLLSLRNPVCRV